MANLTQEAQNGWLNQAQVNTYGGKLDNPHIYSSACWYAYESGAAFYLKGYTQPTKATMGRGHSVNVQTVANDFVVKFPGDLGDAPVIYRK